MARKSTVSAGERLRQRLTEHVDFDDHEQAVLDLACRQADDIARLEAVLDEQGPLVPMASGGSKLNPALAELRQQRLALGKLIDQLRIPAEGEQTGRTPASRRAQRAAQARWAREAS